MSKFSSYTSEQAIQLNEDFRSTARLLREKVGMTYKKQAERIKMKYKRFRQIMGSDYERYQVHPEELSALQNAFSFDLRKLGIEIKEGRPLTEVDRRLGIVEAQIADIKNKLREMEEEKEKEELIEEIRLYREELRLLYEKEEKGIGSNG